MAGQKLAGISYLKINGKLIRTTGQISMKMGGRSRTAVKGHSVYGYSEEVMEGEISGEFVLSGDDDLADLNNTAGATVTWETDTGQLYLLANAFITEPIEATVGEGSSAVSFTFQGDPIEEI